MSDLMMPRFLSVRPSACRTDTGRSVRSWRIALRTYLTRRTLPDLTARELADIGLSSAMAVAEAARLPWDYAPGPRQAASGIAGAVQGFFERARARRLTARRGAVVQ